MPGSWLTCGCFCFFVLFVHLFLSFLYAVCNLEEMLKVIAANNVLEMLFERPKIEADLDCLFGSGAPEWIFGLFRA